MTDFKQSQSHVTTDGQSTSLSWNKAPIWNLRPDFYYCQTVAGLLMWGAVFDERTGPSFTIAPGPCQCRHFRVRLPWDSWPYLLCQTRDFPFRRILRLAGLQWTYSTPPPHGSPDSLSSQSHVTTDEQSADFKRPLLSPINLRCGPSENALRHS
jgi:hypothetical protein